MREAKRRNFSRESELANCSGRRSAEGRDTCLAHWPRTSHECELGLEGLLLHPVPLRIFGGTRRSLILPRGRGTTGFGGLICPGASKTSEANRLRLEPLLADYTFYRMRAEFSRQIGGARGWLLLVFQYVTDISGPKKIAQGADSTKAKKHREIKKRRASEIAKKIDDDLKLQERDQMRMGITT
jgi:hypothetical protein